MDSIFINSSFSTFSFNLSNPRTTKSFHFKLNYFKKKLRISPISVSYKPDSNYQTTSQCCKNGLDLGIRPFSALFPILKSIKVLAAKASENQWHRDLDEFGDKFLHNGGFGMALLSVTSTARVRISPFVSALAANPTFVSGFFAWVIAQSMKVFLHFYFERKWDLSIICASGGMPSSHSALCTALTTSVAICHGVADSLFPVCLGFSLIVMYDAIGVRRHAGMQAQVLNLIVEDLFQGHPISQRKLKELLGHTPSQVVAGALLGIVVACFCCQGCLIPI